MMQGEGRARHLTSSPVKQLLSMIHNSNSNSSPRRYRHKGSSHCARFFKLRSHVISNTLGCSELKQDQMQVVTAVLRGQDVFAVLATERRKTQVTPHDTPRGPAECCSVTVIYRIM